MAVAEMRTPIAVGDAHRSEPRALTDGDIAMFATASDDDNPVHFDDWEAREAGFSRGRVCHGILVAGSIGALIARTWPCAVYLGQTLSFRAAVYPGERVAAEIEVVNVRESRSGNLVVSLRTTVLKVDGTVVIEGDAAVRVRA